MSGELGAFPFFLISAGLFRSSGKLLSNVFELIGEFCFLRLLLAGSDGENGFGLWITATAVDRCLVEEGVEAVIFFLGERVAWDDGRDAVLVFGESALWRVEAKIGLAGIGIEAMAGEATVGEKRTNVVVEIDVVFGE